MLLVLAAAVLILFAKLALWSLAAAALMSGAALWLKKWGEDKKKYLDSHPPPKDEGRSP